MSDSILQKDKKYIWHPFTPLQGGAEPIPIVSAKGTYLFTEDGRAILDAVSSWWVNIHGHSRPEIAQAIAQQAMDLEHVIFAGFTHAPATNLAEKLVSIFPENISKVFYSDNGSTSVEVALKMAIQYWFNRGERKNKIIAIEGAYHGDTFGSMSVGDRSVFSAPFNPFLFDVEFIPFPDDENEEEVFEKFSAIARTKNVAAFIYEPLVQGAAGMRMYKASFLERLLTVARSNQIIGIADEVMTGFGRTGKFFASDHLKVEPDIICVSKGITGGFLPLGVTACSQKITEAFDSPDKNKTFYHGHSYTANPIACAAALASFELLMSLECQQNIARITKRHSDFVDKIKGHKMIKQARSLGTILAIELLDQQQSSYFSDLRLKIYPYFLERDILLRPLGNVIYLIPPYIISNEDLDRVYVEIELFINKL